MGNEKIVSGCVFKVLFQIDCESKEILSNVIVGKERCHSGDCNLSAVSKSHPPKKEIKRDWKCRSIYSQESYVLAALEENMNKNVMKGMSGS